MSHLHLYPLLASVRTLAVALALAAVSLQAQSQSLYFPPLGNNIWQTVSPASLGWCTPYLDSLRTFLDERHTKAFIVLKDGRIAVEYYFDNFTRDSIWYWASAGKTLTAFMIGQVQEDGLLNIHQPSAQWLGAGWTSAPPHKEALITVRHQLTMSTGLETDIPDLDCTSPACLLYRADAGTRWFYHNAPYTLLTNILTNATGQTLNAYFASKIRNRVGMRGLWVQIGYNQVYFSDARSMARFGLMILNRGTWATDTLLRDTAYFQAMTTPSQSLNPSYGYLWWLNGQAGYCLPGVDIQFPGWLIPNAPADLIAALGKNDQKLYVVPSLNMVVVRMGESASGMTPVLSSFDNQLWGWLRLLFCNNVTANADWPAAPAPRIFPNLARQHLWVDLPDPSRPVEVLLFDRTGRLLFRKQNCTYIQLPPLPAGIYLAHIRYDAQVYTQRLILLPQ